MVHQRVTPHDEVRPGATNLEVRVVPRHASLAAQRGGTHAHASGIRRVVVVGERMAEVDERVGASADV